MRIALGISYQGTAYHGWQSQAGLLTVQSVLEKAIANVADHPIALTCAGRTDKGVHALGQVVHFDTIAVRSDRSWLLGSNSHLSADIRIDWVRRVSNQFHARFSALARRYRYLIYNKPLLSALWHKHTTHCYYPLDEMRMQTAAKYLLGEHDFSSFRAMSCQSKSAFRNIQRLVVSRQKDNVIIDITANAFLHHMVRNIAGLLMLIGAGKREPSWAKEVLLAKDRKKATLTAKPTGLYLLKVFYPESFLIPSPDI
ncbi:MAG: tRNA pseudouridine(38-40) synthase TruA [Rickettsiella sp.]|nr:tRNA pseudouridine(38-40) synthase TruA [Rickettsiella sp.]